MDHENDALVFGNPDDWKILMSRESRRDQWSNRTTAYELSGIGCLVQITSHRRLPDRTWESSKAVTFVPGVRIMEEMVNGEIVNRRLVKA